ncbi:hypothetical protein BCV69DRAFT_23730 [Microstroma glucosiphilum]|uniref:Uncharacterized protein n=1 Tax=Pseudomicrostroma glucosiphilum TaxID=1684307 RepID=A0A316UG37_9BASI|nr:hypothetical protein BCV69DRAFT_23730 [Pseudomicrostroma glucosiphilum]PWN24222.1 hypothetical protein BCV69DRAFT_23730 [Pseudomicrostroma glucosiphilum]
MATSTLSPSSLHPVLRVTFPSGFFSAGPSSTCDPYLLLSLPPALFLDPWQEPIHPVLQAQLLTQNQIQSTDGKVSSRAAGIRIEQVDFLSAGYPSQVELEKAVGWTGASASSGGAAYSGRAVWQGKDERTRLLRSSSRGEEEGSNSAGGSKKAANREREAVLLRFSSSPSSAGSSKQKLRLPLHARYLPPVDSSQASLTSRLLSPHGSGNYIEVAIEGLEVFWACTAGSAPQELEEEQEWERLARPSSLLPMTQAVIWIVAIWILARVRSL